MSCCLWRKEAAASQVITNCNCLKGGFQSGKEMDDDFDAPRPKRERKQAQAFIAIERVSKPLVIEVSTSFASLFKIYRRHYSIKSSSESPTLNGPLVVRL